MKKTFNPHSGYLPIGKKIDTNGLNKAVGFSSIIVRSNSNSKDLEKENKYILS